MKKNTSRQTPVNEKKADFLLPQALMVAFMAFWLYFVMKNYLQSMGFNPFNLNILRWIFFTGHYGVHQGASASKALLSHVHALALLLLVVLAVYGAGKRIWDALKLSDGIEPLPQEAALYQVALGVWALIYFTLALGVMGVLYRQVIWLFTAVFAAAGAYELKKIAAGRGAPLGAPGGAPGGAPAAAGRRIMVLPFLLVAAALAVNLAGALVPETFYDSLAYNIGLSQNWINHHRIFSTEFMVTSFFPLNFTVLYTAGILLKDEILAKLMALAFGAGTAYALYVFCRKYFTRESGWLAAAVFYTTPMVMLISWKTAIELGLTFYEVLALFCFVNFAGSGKRKWLYICAVFAGVSMGGKYTSFFTALTLAVLVFARELFTERKNFLKSMANPAVFSAIVFSVVCVWYVKNFIVTGDPLYPLSWVLQNQMTSSDPAPIKLTLSNVLLFPWKYTMGNLQQESYLGPVMLLALPLFFCFRKQGAVIRHLCLYFLLYFFLWVTVGKGYSRFFLPAAASISVVTGVYLANGSWSAVSRNLLAGFFFLAMLANIYHAALIQKSTMDPLGFLTGRQRKTEYLFTQRNTYPYPYYAAAEWLNKNAPPGAKVLVLGECRGYYIDRRYLINMAGDKSPLMKYCAAAGTPEGLQGLLEKDGITHIMLNVPEAVRLRGYDRFYFSAGELKLFCGFWEKYLAEVHRSCPDVTLNNGIFGSGVPDFWNRYSADTRNYVYVYRVLSREEARLPHEAPFNFFMLPEMYKPERCELLKPVIEGLQRGNR